MCVRMKVHRVNLFVGVIFPIWCKSNKAFIRMIVEKNIGVKEICKKLAPMKILTIVLFFNCATRNASLE